MTVSSVDTAELPRVRTQTPTAPVFTISPLELPAPAPTPTSAPAPVFDLRPAPVCRAELRAERRHQRRQRRLYAFFGLSILGAALGSTVVVLGVVR